MSTNGRILWYPTGTTFRASDLGTRWTRIQESLYREEYVEDNAYGCRTSIAYASRRLVTAQLELLADRAAVRELEAITEFLRSRNTIAIAEHDDCYIGGLVVPPVAGATTLLLTTQPWEAWGAGDGFVEGDVFVLQAPGPNPLREELVVTGWDGFTLELQDPVIFDYTDAAFAWVRDARFRPFLRLRREASGEMLTSDRRITWNLTLPLEEVPVSEETLTTPFAGP